MEALAFLPFAVFSSWAQAGSLPPFQPPQLRSPDSGHPLTDGRNSRTLRITLGKMALTSPGVAVRVKGQAACGSS